jgi:hypothetical protein
MPKAANSERQALTGEDLDCLADLAKVSEDEHELFVTEVHETVDLAWERHDLVSSCPANKSIKALEKTASTLYKSLRTLSKSERKFLGRVVEDSPFVFDKLSGEGTLLGATYQIAHLFSMLTGKPPPPYPHLPQRPTKRGKPSGSVDNWILQDFVFDLILCARVAGGRLPVDAKLQKGPLISAMGLLNPYLPVALVRKPLSAATLRRINELVSMVVKQHSALG